LLLLFFSKTGQFFFNFLLFAQCTERIKVITPTKSLILRTLKYSSVAIKGTDGIHVIDRLPLFRHKGDIGQLAKFINHFPVAAIYSRAD
jgi:hypothetical protein